jgi:hypothetical protein
MAAPLAKKARIEEPKAYGDLDIESATLRVVPGTERYLIPLFNGEVTYIVLTPTPAKIAYGFDVRGQYE